MGEPTAAFVLDPRRHRGTGSIRATMRPDSIVRFSAILAAVALSACSGAQPEAVAPPATATPAAPAVPASAESAPPATAAATAAPAPAPPADPLLAGLTGGDVDWAKHCLDGDGSY